MTVVVNIGGPRGNGRARVKPNNQRAPGPLGNTTGLVVPDTAPAPHGDSAPPIKPTEAEKGWWGQWGSDVLHTGLDIVGLIPGVGEIADGANALVYLAEGDKINAAISAAAMIPGAGMAATGAKYGKKALGAVAEAAGKKTARELEEAAAKKAAREAEEKAAKEAEEAAAKKAEGKGGGKDNGNPRCVLRPFKPDTCKPRTGHHVVPDRSFQIGGRKTGARIPGGLSEADGLVICVDGATPKPSNEHGKIHNLYDAAERIIGAAGKPPGTAPLIDLELAGAAAAAKVTKCNAVSLAAQLRAYHQLKGMGPDFLVRADKMGTIANRIPIKTFGTSAKHGAGTF